MTLTHYPEIEEYVTKDGSRIRELMHPSRHTCHQQSLAEARVSPGGRTTLHRHRVTEEFYHVTAGAGSMTLGEACFPIAQGDTIAIPPGTPHAVHNTGEEELVILCCCSPAYSHDDTELL